MLRKEDIHEEHKGQHGAQHEHGGAAELGGSHQHDTHKHDHGQMTDHHSEQVAEHHSHEKGEDSTEHVVSEHNPA